MNTPLPSAVPSTNVTLKEDASSSSSASTSCSILKTAAGDVVLSLFSSEGSAPASLSSLATLALAQISAMAGDKTDLFQDCAHNFVFLSPETVELEIQIADLLQTLETLNPQTTSEEKTHCKQQEQSLLHKGYEPREVAPRSAKDIPSSSKTLPHPLKAFSGHASAKTSDSRPSANSSTIPHNSEQYTSRASHSSTPSQQPRTEKESDFISYSSSLAYTTEKKNNRSLQRNLKSPNKTEKTEIKSKINNVTGNIKKRIIKKNREKKNTSHSLISTKISLHLLHYL